MCLNENYEQLNSHVVRDYNHYTSNSNQTPYTTSGQLMDCPINPFRFIPRKTVKSNVRFQLNFVLKYFRYEALKYFAVSRTFSMVCGELLKSISSEALS